MKKLQSKKNMIETNIQQLEQEISNENNNNTKTENQIYEKIENNEKNDNFFKIEDNLIKNQNDYLSLISTDVNMDFNIEITDEEDNNKSEDLNFFLSQQNEILNQKVNFLSQSNINTAVNASIQQFADIFGNFHNLDVKTPKISENVYKQLENLDQLDLSEMQALGQAFGLKTIKKHSQLKEHLRQIQFFFRLKRLPDGISKKYRSDIVKLFV